ncbi:MAG TPA: HEAT repeat domain-containing protein [Gemmatimonadales bacterium]|nr:HEAT repeat domain-containing protein [Gemmatimonadales bacterium]
MRHVAALAAILVLLPSAAAAQSLAERVRAAGDGALRLSFASRPGVCGSGSSITVIDHDDNDRDSEWEGDCERGPVRVSFRVQGGRVTAAETRVGGRWRDSAAGGTDLGLAPAKEAAALLLDLARGAGDEEGGDLISAATLADSAVVWPTLLELARDRALPTETRRQAVFWLGQAAGEAATRGLDSIVGDDRDDLEVREHAVFALSQRPGGEGVSALIRIARTSPHPELRRKALFWLGQTEDPRALALFEDLLR